MLIILNRAKSSEMCLTCRAVWVQSTNFGIQNVHCRLPRIAFKGGEMRSKQNWDNIFWVAFWAFCLSSVALPLVVLLSD